MKTIVHFPLSLLLWEVEAVFGGTLNSNSYQGWRREDRMVIMLGNNVIKAPKICRLKGES